MPTPALIAVSSYTVPPTPRPHSASRLALLLSRSDAGGAPGSVSPAVLAEARALGLATTAALVNVLLAGALRVPQRDRSAEAACDLAGALQLETTLPRLLALVDVGRTPLSLYRAAVRAIGRMGPAALGPVGEAVEKARARVELHRGEGEERLFSSAVARLGRHLEAAAAVNAALRETPAANAPSPGPVRPERSGRNAAA